MVWLKASQIMFLVGVGMNMSVRGCSVKYFEQFDRLDTAPSNKTLL